MFIKFPANWKLSQAHKCAEEFKMKNIVKGIFLSLLVLMLISMNVNAYEIPIIAYEEPTPSWFEQLFREPLDVTGGSTAVDTVNKGSYVDFTINLKFYHDCEKHKLRFYFMGPDSLTRISNEREAIYNYPHKTGDVTTALIKNIETNSISDSYCDKQIYLGVFHYSYYNGVWNLENSRRISDYFVLKCPPLQCEEKPIGSLYCDADGDVVQNWQFKDCDTAIMTMDSCFDRGCSNGVCVDLICETGPIGSKFCKENSVYQRYGLGKVVSICKYEDRLIQQCAMSQKCDGGQCINTEYCGNGICDAGETHNTCPSDCPPDWKCGDKVCNSDETQSNCCWDCGCPEGYTCINNVCEPSGCSAGETKTKVCEDGKTVIVTHTCQNYNWVETQNKCPSGGNWWIWVLVALIIGGAGTGIYFMVRKKR